MTDRRNLKRSSKAKLSKRRLNHETLEKRELLAAEIGADAPRLIAVAANSGENFDLNDNNVLSVAPSELTFRFGGGQELDPATLSAIRFIPSGGDGSFDANDQPITPGFLGFADDDEGSRIVVARFAETLADDSYKIEIAGFDDTNEGIVGLRNADGTLFAPTGALNPLRPIQDIRFEVEVGPRVTAVVPQPIEGTGAARVQFRDQIHVYFNEDPLSNPAAGPIDSTGSSLPVVNPSFYKLIFTADTVENTDDVTHEPILVQYDPALNRVVLTFASDLSELPIAAANNGAATYRLRIGSGDALPAPPIQVDGSADAGDLFSNAQSLGVSFGAGIGSVVVGQGVIQAQRDVIPQWPGAGDAVGRRDQRRDQEVVGRIDTDTGINIFEYNFATLYGLDPQLNRLDNAITEAQKDRVRDVLSLYSERLGVQFIETANRGLQFVTGDLRAIVTSADTGAGPQTPYSLYRVNESDPSQGVLVLDAGENWYDEYGLSPDARPSYFVEAIRGVGNLLGIGHLFHLPNGVGAGGTSPDEPNSTLFSNFFPNLPNEPEFLSQSDITLGQALHRPESDDVDFYSFSASTPGTLKAETFAERLDGSSLLDTNLMLYRVVDALAGEFELIARNDDFFSNDSFIGVELEAGDYIIGVSASGNDQYNGEIANSGIGGRSEGRYELRVTFEGEGSSSIVDTSGTELDGDADGVAGGDFNFWFRTARDTASPAADEARVIYVDKEGDDANTGTLGLPVRTISAAFGVARPGDIVRLLPNGGADGLVQTTADNLAYEIGRGGTGNAVLRDGAEFEVPKGVAVMIDAGAILKLQAAKISVGSESVDEDRSLASLQVLGTPLPTDDAGNPLLDNAGSVFFTSYNDESIAVDTNPLPTTPQAGNWAGLEFRNDFDYAEGRPVWESEGIFLDYASHADMQYGGGSISPTQPVVNPIQMLEARPTLIYNTIRNSADAAISADPNSFLETNFHAPIFQRVASFTSDYDRVGPEISGNTLIDNSINGLFIRVLTPAAGQLEPMTVSGRLDDTDIVHALSQVLVLQGQPGGPLLLEERPDVLNVTVAPTAGGTLSAGEAYDYRITYVTTEGSESLASLPTVMGVADVGGAIQLNNLPAAPAEFAGRRLYRLDPSSGDYVFVEALDRGTTAFLDTGASRGGLLPGNGADNATFLPRFDARLSIDPGIVVKLQSARIETTNGADFYAEGRDGQEVVFTSRLDDTYGAGGTFDTNNDGDRNVAGPGDWGGLVFRQDSTASLDFVELAFAGGTSLVEGDFTEFNAVEILQADVRIAHSTIRDNADGFTAESVRAGRGFNSEATIFVRGSQPILVDNTIANNEGAAISINPDALNYYDIADGGRSTGAVDRFDTDRDNQGPLIAANRLANNGINGMVVRSELLTTESVWDDTDIVHVVNGEIHSMTHHFRSGLRLKSDANQSLVVKFDQGASLVGSGRPLDIVDRVGGTLQVLGQGGFPVILTSIHDDSVGAGFSPAGVAQTDTDNIDQAPAPGDWGGLQLLSYVNDRNVAYVIEAERGIPAAVNENAVANDAQVIGLLAANEFAGDENARLGFNIRGTLATPLDRDVYRFDATGGTEIYVDIDDSTYGLDTVVELIDVNNNVLARSDNSFEEITDPSRLLSNLPPGTVQPLYQIGTGQVESPNVLDAGFRVVVPGSNTSVNTYFVRVRSAAGESEGQYQLSVRLREADEIAGSTIQLADIRYATDAILVSGAPLHSPLVGDFNESLQYDNNGNSFDANASNLSFTRGNADQVGNLLTSDRGSLVITGEIGNASPTIVGETRLNDLDVYQVDLFAQQLEPDVFDSENRFVPVTFDIDYADGLGRVNTSIAVYDNAGRLILHSRDSNIADDQGRPTLGTDSDNLPGGSAGITDAYIGPVELPEGTYFVVVSNAAAIPAALGQFFQTAPVNQTVRLAPVNSVRRIVNENFDGNFYTADTTIHPTNVTFTDSIDYSLDDIRLFVSFDSGIGGGPEASTIASINPFTGTLERLIGEWLQGHGDIAIRDDGEIFTYTTNPPPNAQSINGNIGNYLRISSVNGAATQNGDDGITYRRTNQAGTGLENDSVQNGPDATLLIEAIAFPLNDTSFNNQGNGGVNNTNAVTQGERFFVVGNRSLSRDPSIPTELQRNILHQMRTVDGIATNLGSTAGNLNLPVPQSPYFTTFGPAGNRLEQGIVDTGFIFNSGGDGGDITGIGFVPDAGTDLIGVTELGGVHRFSPNNSVPAPASSPAAGYSRIIPTTYYGQVDIDPLHAQLTGRSFPAFSSMAFGPRNIQSQAFRDVIFATTVDGWLYAFSIENDAIVPANIFVDGRSAVPIATVGGTASPSPVGLAFSTLEAAPWHQTTDRRGDVGHRELIPHDQSRLEQISPNNSLYYGFEIDGNAANNTIERPDGDPLGQLAPGGSHGSVISAPFSLEGYSSGDQPTVYFSYFIEVEAQDDYLPGTRLQNDSFRVFASGDDGSWIPLATNNDFRQLGSDDEYDAFFEGTNALFEGTEVPVQELFDDAGVWRQARIDISPLAGNENVRLRFDFSTSGGMRSHIGSAELVARPGDEIPDRSTFQVGNVTFENVVGRDVLFPNGSQLTDGDQFQATGPGGAITTVTFREAPVANPGPNEVVFQSSDSAADLVDAAVQAIDKSLRPYSDGFGRLSLLAASNLQVLGDAPFGQDNAELLAGNLDRLTIPAGSDLFAGEQIILIGQGTTATLTYVDVDNGIPGEIFFSPTDTPNDIALRVLDAIPPVMGAYLDDSGTIVFAKNVFVQQVASQTRVAVTDPVSISEARKSLTIPLDTTTLTAGDTIDITRTDNTVFQLTLLNLDFDLGLGFVGIANADPLVVARRLYDALPTDVGAILNGTEITFLANDVVINGNSALVPVDVTLTGDFFQLNLADGVDLRSGERITIGRDSNPGDAIKFDGGFETITFVETGDVTNVPNNVIFFDDTQTAADLFAQVVALFGPQFGAYLDPSGNGINFTDPTVVFDLNDRDTFYNPFAPAHVVDPIYTIVDNVDVQTSVVPITLPEGALLQDGDTLTLIAKDDPNQVNTTTITFRQDIGLPAGPNEVLFSDTDSADVITLRLLDVIPVRYQAYLQSPREIFLANGFQAITNPGSAVIAFGTQTPGAVAVNIDSSMTSGEVAERIRVALAEGLGRLVSADGISRATPDQYPLLGGDRIRIYTTFINEGPYGVHQSPFGLAMPGDEFGESVSGSFTAANQIRTNGAANNTVEGVYIDEIVVGFAERGEMVLNAPANNFNYLLNPETLPDSHSQAIQPELQNETLVGEYSLEIRTADDYGVPQDYDPINLLLGESFAAGRSIDTNDRLADGAVTLLAPSSQGLVDGDTFVLYDGTRSLTFEFDDILNVGVAQGHVAIPYDASETDPQFVAAAIRDAINSPQAQSVLQITAATIDSRDGGTPDPTAVENIDNGDRVELFGPAIQVNPGGGRFIRMDLVEEETYQGRETSRLIPIVDHVNQTVTYTNFGDQIDNALVTGFVDGRTDVFVGVGKIGDQVDTGVISGDGAAVLGSVPFTDQDNVRIYLEAGVTVDIDVDSIGFAKGANVLTRPGIIVFDEDENFVGVSSFTPTAAPGESTPGAFLAFTAPQDGYYDVQVRSFDTSFGEYQLTIRPQASTSAAIPDRDVLMVDYQFGTTDVNRVRDQGQILIAGNFISNTSGVGITATAGPRGQAFTNGGVDDTPRPGSARLLRNQNTDALIPGAVISNNVVFDSAGGGILFSGGTQQNGEAPAPVPFGRIVNNTVVGNGTGSGIIVASSASPTLLNNVVSGFNTGLNVDASSAAAGTVVGGNAYQSNNTNSTIPIASTSFEIADGIPLFADPARDLYIPATGSDIIDASFSSLPDRGDFFLTVKDPAGISPSPIIAPAFDAYGQPRVDDPTVTSPGGVGANVFIDRGAIDRADQTRPVAVLTAPQDAIATTVPDGDGDPDESFVRLSNGTVEFFEVQLLDPSGTGPDIDTITADSVLLTENGRRLIPDVDFTFGYSDNSRTIRLTPLAGLWRPDAVYEITLNNQQRIAYEAPSGDQIVDGDRLTLIDEDGAESVFEFESGFTVNVPQTTTFIVRDTNAGFVDRDTFTIIAPDGNSLTFEINLAGSTAGGNIEIDLRGTGTVQEVRQAILDVFSNPAPADPTMTIAEFLDISPVLLNSTEIQLGTLAGHTVAGAVAGMDIVGVPGGVPDGGLFNYTSGDTTVVFEFDFDGNADPDGNGHTIIPLLRTDSPETTAEKIVIALRASVLGLATAQSIGDGAMLIGGGLTDVLDLDTSNLALTGSPGVTGALTLSVASDALADNLDDTTFTIDVGTLSVDFRYTTDPTLTSADRLILLDSADTPDQIAAKTAAEISAAYPDELSPSVSGLDILLGEQAALPPAGEARVITRVNTGTSGLALSGVSGGAIPINFLPTAQFTPAGVAATVQAAINAAPLNVATFAPGGGTLLISNAASLSLTQANGTTTPIGTLTPAVSDLAGNAVRETRINNETRFTIIMPEVVFDLGDAPESYGTLLDGNGARHTLGGEGSPVLGQFVDSENDGQPFPNSDDAEVSLTAAEVGGKFEIDTNNGQIQVTVNDDLALGGETFLLEIGGTIVTYELVDAASNPAAGNIAVNFAPSDTAATIASNLIAAVRAQVATTGGAVLLAGVDGDPASFTIRSVDDEDGVSVGTLTTGGNDFQVFTVPGTDPNNVAPEDVLGFLNPLDAAGSNLAVTVTGAGLIDAWIDYDQNGNFEDDEQVLKNQPVVDGVNVLSIAVPANATPGDTWARFRISDGGNLTPTGVAVGGEVEDYPISVLPIALPSPVDDAFDAVEDTPLEILDGGPQGDLFDNDNDLNGQLLPVRFFIGDQPANGTVEIIDQFTGEFRYTPNPDFYGTDTFTYRLSSQQNESADAIASAIFATVTISVSPVNDNPLAADQEFVTTEGGTLTVTADQLLAGAQGHENGDNLQPPQDESDQVLTVISVSAGGVTIDANNPTATATTPQGATISATFGAGGILQTVTYTLDNDFNSDNLSVDDVLLLDEFVFTIQDDGLLAPPNFGTISDQPLTDSATARIRVTPQNDNPGLVSDVVGIGNPDYLAFYDALNIQAPVPTEDASIIIEPEFLLANDASGPDTAADEQQFIRGNDGDLTITDVAIVDPTRGTISLEPTGDILFTPAPNVYGEVFFTYTAVDQGIDEDVDGNRVLNPMTTTITSAVFLEPVNDAPLAADRLLTLDEAVEPGGPAVLSFTAADLINGNAANGETPVLPGAFDPALGTPDNEAEQAFRVVAFSLGTEVVDVLDLVGPGEDVADAAGQLTLNTPAGGLLTFNFAGGAFTIGTYEPPADYNERDPFPATEVFSYTVEDNGRTTITNPAEVRDLEDLRSVVPGTITITVSETNDPPVYDAPTVVDVLEIELDDPAELIVPGFVTNVAPGPATALDELAVQSVSFEILSNGLSNPTNLMLQPPVVNADGSLSLFPRPDAFGQASFIVRGTDDDATDPRSTEVEFVVNVRPVNDAPRFDPNVAGTSDSNGPDDQYSVANVVGNNGLITDATISYTLREDNTQPTGNPNDPVTTGDFFIPIAADTSNAGFNRVGLLDVFTVGPDNEASSVPSGDQTLELFEFPSTTDLGGSLVGVFDGATLIGLSYTPPVDLNNDIGLFDSFTYTVRDNSGTGGETYSLNDGDLIEDRLTSANVVQLNLNPVNDRPEFSTATLDIEVQEDAPSQFIDRFAFNIAAGPSLSAFDEVDVNTGQSFDFSVAALSFDIADAELFFSEFPSISPTGDLTFRPAPDVFGVFEFEVVLTDNGPDNSTRGDLISSVPVTLTIDVQPVNDPPVVDPTVPPLQFELFEDGFADILVRGDNVTPGLLDQFLPGPANESEDILPDPGGNQSVVLSDPIPATTANGGTLIATSGPNGVTSLRYIPRANFTGTDSFIYTVSDDGQTVTLGTGGSAVDDPRIASTTVTLEVLPINDAPQFSGGNDVTLNEDAGLVDLTNWATNVQAGPASASDEIDGANGTPAQNVTFEIIQIDTTNPNLFAVPPSAVVNGESASLQFRTTADASGEATFEVRLRDDGPTDAGIGDDNLSDSKTFTIRINPVNDPPSFTPGGEVAVVEDSGPFNAVWASNVSAGPDDEAGQTVFFTVETPPSAADLFLVAPQITPTGFLQFTPAENANGIADVIVRASDSAGATADDVVLRIIIDGRNDIPVAVADQFTANEDEALNLTSGDLLANDFDVDAATDPNETLTVILPAETFTARGARLTFNSVTGELVYDPTNASVLQALPAGQTLSDSFTYRIQDTAGSTSFPVTVDLTVEGRNDAPVLLPDSPSLNQSGTTTITPLLNDVDIDGTIDPTSIQIFSQPARGSVEVRDNGTIVYTPFVPFDGTDTLSYTVADESGLRSQPATIVVGSNTAPVAGDDSASTFIGEGVTINVLENDVDNDNQLDPTSVTVTRSPAFGQAIVQNDGSIRYVPGNDFVGNDTFEYTVADQAGNVSDQAVVSVRVLGSRLQNPTDSRDVNDDGFVTAIDALLVINRLNRAGNVTSIPVENDDVGPPYYDVNGDRQISAQDALLVINELTRRGFGGAGQGEGEQAIASPLADSSQDGSEATVDSPVSTVEDSSDRVVGASTLTPVADDLIDLLIKGQSDDQDEDEAVESVDAAMAKLI